MKINSLFILLLLTILCGCGNPLTKQHSKAVKRLDTINAGQLIQECNLLLENSKGKEIWDFPRENWPASIKRINPLMVHLSANEFSVSLALEKWAGNEMGIIVTPSEANGSSSDPPSDTWKKMEPYIYWYAN